MNKNQQHPAANQPHREEVEDGQDLWMDLLEALPPEIHNSVHGVALLANPQWINVEEREQILFIKGGRRARRDALRYLVKGVNERGSEVASWSGTVLQTVAGFDVAMVRELLTAGVRADHLYRDYEDGLWDIASYALFVFAERAKLFQDTAKLWATKCAEIITLAVRAGGTTRVNVWLGAEVAPVLALLEHEALTLTGLESWRELEAELAWKEGMNAGEVVCRFLDARDMLIGEARAFECGTAQARFEGALNAWLDGVPEE